MRGNLEDVIMIMFLNKTGSVVRSCPTAVPGSGTSTEMTITNGLSLSKNPVV